MPLFDETLKNVSFDNIDFNKYYFKISRNHIGDKLIRSIKDFGILQPPVLLFEKNHYTIVYGHNRISVMKLLGTSCVDAIVINKINQEYYKKQALLKSIYMEIGPAGKIKLIKIFSDYFKIKSDELNFIGKNCLGLPDDFINDINKIKKFNDLPIKIRDYLDLRDINFKIINNIIKLSNCSIKKITEWLEKAVLKVNIFKNIIEMIHDIERRDSNSDKLKLIDFDDYTDSNVFEKHLFKSIFNIRYPEYSKKRKEVDEVIKKLNKDGINIDFPEYFNGNQITLSVKLKKNDDLTSLKSNIDNSVINEKIKQLLNML